MALECERVDSGFNVYAMRCHEKDGDYLRGSCGLEGWQICQGRVQRLGTEEFLPEFCALFDLVWKKPKILHFGLQQCHEVQIRIVPHYGMALGVGSVSQRMGEPLKDFQLPLSLHSSTNFRFKVFRTTKSA